MLHCIDRHGHDFGIQIGDTCRFPLSTRDFGRTEIYSNDLRGIDNRNWEVIAFGGKGFEHCAIVQRRHDGLTKTIALHWIATYSNPYLRGGRYYPKEAIALRAKERHSKG